MSEILCFHTDGHPLRGFFQWDHDQKIIIEGATLSPVPLVHFCNKNSKEAIVVTPTVSGQQLLVDVPNILLQEPDPIIGYLYRDNSAGGQKTIFAFPIGVIPRPMPDDYIYNDNVEYLSVAILNSRLNALIKAIDEGGGGGGGGEGGGGSSIEVIDIRTGYDGTLYDLAGDAVRAIGQRLTEYMDEAGQEHAFIRTRMQQVVQTSDRAMEIASSVENETAGLSGEIESLSGNVSRLSGMTGTYCQELEVDEDGLVYLLNNGERIAGPYGPFAGGGGGGGGSGNNAVLTLTNTSGWTSKTITAGAACPITITWSSLEDDMPTGNGSLRIMVGGAVKGTMNVAQGAVQVDLGPYLVSGQSNTVQLAVTDIYGNRRTIMVTVDSKNLSISSTFDTSVPYEGAIQFPYTPNGNGIEKTVHFILDSSSHTTEKTSVHGRQLTHVIPAQSHGSHSLEVYFDCTINGERVESNHLYFEFISIVSGNRTPIITSSFNQTTAQQYHTINLDYTVYNPTSVTTAITISVNGNVVSSATVDRTRQIFTYRPNTAGDLTITISSGSQGQEGYVTKTWTLYVEAVDIDVEPDTDKLSLYLSARGRSSSETTRENWAYNDIAATLSGFNWRINGWTKDDEGIDVLRLCDDARVTIPFNLFGRAFNEGGRTIEVEFSTREVANYGADILTCVSGGVGLRITPQTVFFSGAQTSLSAMYKENEHIRLTITVSDQMIGYRLVLVYINGIESRAIQYAPGETFRQINPVGITIGSNDCGIDIYNIRVYDKCLDDRGVLRNWIADTQDGAELLDRYTRNNVYTDSGDISVETLPDDVPYMIIECEKLPEYKGDVQTCSGQFVDPVDSSKSFSFEGCAIDVQGTSSSVYFRKNWDMKFKSGFEMTASGRHQDDYALRTGSIPFNRFVLKADVASSESANNTGLTMFYNDSCPYKVPEMIENPKVRWGIEGRPIVLFWYNPTTGITEFLGKHNFNLPKRAPTPYGYSGDMESWEWERNNSDNVKFKDADFETMGVDEHGNPYPEWYDDFEARFPSDEWRDTAKLGEFLRWVVSTDREQAPNTALAQSVSYDVPSLLTVTPYSSDSSFTTEQIQGGYRITFTKDTPAYRLTKFRAEAANYMEMESAIYYYLFTEQFLMIDSRAKNMFVGFRGSDVNDPNRAMDRKAVFEPYDMDTALGTNNSGVLIFGFSLEDTDTVSSVISGEAGSDAPVYNAQNSVLWMNVRDAFTPEIMGMYRTLRSSGAWSYQVLEDRFENHQKTWCEAIFNEDAWTKYLIPLVDAVTVDEETGRLIVTDRYLTMLQGSKEEQRKWWLYNRFRYIDSKYNTGDASRTLDLRLFSDGTLTITPAIDLYVGVRFGLGSTTQLKRVSAGEPASFVYSSPSGTTEMETSIYSADMIADVGDLSGFYPNELNFARATRLRRLQIGSGATGYSNTNLTVLDVSNAGMLEYIDCRNCPNLGITVNLGGSPRLKEAYFEGTAISGVELADGATIETLHLPGTISVLTLMNLNKLIDLQIADTSNVQRLMLANMSNDIADPTELLSEISTGAQVFIEGLDVSFDSVEEALAFFDLLDTMRGVTRERGVSGEWVYHDFDIAQVSGEVHINDTVSGADMAILQGRCDGKYFISVTADHVVAELRYYNFDGTILYYTQTINDGGDGSYAGRPTRSSDARATYTFVGWSTQMDAEANDPNATKAVWADRDIYAAYSRTYQTYYVTFVNDDGSFLQIVGPIQYGSSAVYTGEMPVSTEDPDGSFDGWTPEPTNITGNTTCTARYKFEPHKMYLANTMRQYISDTATAIASYAFYQRTALETVETSASSISTYAFYGCNNLTVVDLTGSDAVTLAARAFYNCYKLQHVIIRSESVGELQTTTQNSTTYDAFSWTLIGAHIGGIYVPANLVDAYKSATNWSYYADQIYPIEAYPVTDFSTITDSLEEIIAEVNAGTAAEKYSVGDKKRIDFGDGYLYFELAGKNLDTLADESGSAQLTFVTLNALPSRRMNATDTVVGGWAECEMRNDYLPNTIMPQLPEILQQNIKEVTKTYTVWDTETAARQTESCSDKLFLLSCRELNFSNYESSGVPYGYNDYYAGAGRRRIKSGLTTAGVMNDYASSYWTRSVIGSTSYLYISGGSNWYNVPTSNNRVVFGFCL